MHKLDAVRPLLFLLLGASAPAFDAQEVEKLLKSKDPTERVKAVAQIVAQSPADAEKLLLDALDDRDFEVQEMAAQGLGERGSAQCFEALLEAALEAPVRRIRQRAAESLAKAAPQQAVAALEKALKKKNGLQAAQALALISNAAPSDAARAAVASALESKDHSVQDAAAHAAAVLEEAALRKALTAWIENGRILAAANAIESVRARPGSLGVGALVQDVLARAALPDVLERRAIDAVAAAIKDGKVGDVATRAEPLIQAIRSIADARPRARCVRALDALSRAARDAERRPGASILAPDLAIAALAPALEDKNDAVRAAAVHALAGTADASMLAALRGFAKDPSERVRRAAIRGLVENTGAAAAETQSLLCELLAADDDDRLREECAVFLGRRDCATAVPALEKALQDSVWTVSVCAAVSLGKTRSEAALAPLLVSAENPDWRIRAAALVGLGHLDRAEAIPVLIEALGSKEPVFQHTAYGFLRRLTQAEFGLRKKAWEDWWNEAKASFTFVDREAATRAEKKHGYATSTSGLYQGLDILVFQSRGDHIEQLLEKLEIEHRLTMAGNVAEAGVQPFAVFVSNCEGAVTPADADFVTWFVRVGGYLFCSCWALHQTVEVVQPGPVRKAETRGEVLDLVEARACRANSPYLEGVFEPLVRPQYVLYGAHLIQVLEPESVDVLIDSPACAERWGPGDLACWFRSGHGLILDSANHFDLQGLERVEGLKRPEDRQIWAIDHMGLPYAEMRELDRRKVFDKPQTANEELRDLSTFRFLTNFVREKRRADH